MNNVNLPKVQFHSLPWRWYALALIIVALDQATKHFIVATFSRGEVVEFLPVLTWTLRYNPGAAFSMFADMDARVFLSTLSFIVSIGLIVWMAVLNPLRKLEIGGIALVLGGAVGNLYDRAFVGEVVDFIIVFHWFPAFNIADMAISVGAGLLLLDAFLSGDKDSNASDKASKS